MKGETGAAEEDEANEAAGAVEAVSAPGERSNLPIEALGGAVAQARRDEGEDAVEVTPDRASELLEVSSGIWPEGPVRDFDRVC